MPGRTLTSTILVLLAAAIPASAQETLEGRWKVERDDGRSRLQLEHRDRGGRSFMSFSVDQDEVRELPDGRLELRREAGTFELRGDRSGTFVFTASPDFVRGLESRGYDDPGIRELFSLASLDLTLAYLDEMESLGYGGNLRQLVEMRIHGVSGDYVRAFRDLGYADLSGRQLVEMRIHGVAPEFVREMGELGYELSARELVEMRIHGLRSEFVREMAAAGFDDLSARRLVEMKIHGVDPADVRDFAELGVNGLTGRELIEMRIHGVRPEFVREMGEMGYRGLSARQLIEMRIHGVSPSFVRHLEAEGYTDLSARQLVEMKIHGFPRRRGHS